MGSAFAQAVMGVEQPRVALLSNGEEPAKGTPELVEVHEQLAAGGSVGLNFVGNIEGTQVTEGVADVVVMDGFTGNITLKLIEGVSGRTMRAIREAAMSSPRVEAGRLAAAAGDPAASRRDRSRGSGRGVHARPATARRDRPRSVHAARIRARDRGRCAGRSGGRDRAHSRRPARGRGAPRLDSTVARTPSEPTATVSGR